ncbi:hypothetical protein RCL1_000529 [Eukaryota sp. TZLM3-RCL]
MNDHEDLTEADYVPLQRWWLETGYLNYPDLATVAAQITQHCGSASATERNWSIIDHQLPKRRERIGSQLLNDTDHERHFIQTAMFVGRSHERRRCFAPYQSNHNRRTQGR